MLDWPLQRFHLQSSRLSSPYLLVILQTLSSPNILVFRIFLSFTSYLHLFHCLDCSRSSTASIQIHILLALFHFTAYHLQLRQPPDTGGYSYLGGPLPSSTHLILSAISLSAPTSSLHDSYNERNNHGFPSADSTVGPARRTGSC